MHSKNKGTPSDEKSQSFICFAIETSYRTQGGWICESAGRVGRETSSSRSRSGGQWKHEEPSTGPEQNRKRGDRGEARTMLLATDVASAERPTGDVGDDLLDVDQVEDDEQSANVPHLPLDQVFEILKNQRRRHVLAYLNDVGEPVTMSDLSEHIAARENDKEVHQLSSSERKRVYVGLYQCHLPKMDGMGVVEFNKPRGIIEPGPNADMFDEYLETDDVGDERPWPRYYLGLAVASAAMLPVSLVAGSMTAFPFVTATLAAVVGSFLVTSMAHVRDEVDETAPTDGDEYQAAAADTAD